ncbi:O-antigen ligase family protein [Xenorhabdus bovienii]|uniref:O-antigen ligase family protein n=1 Tax=Xenorhabdus bovienii TaxID=40576 RepID=UPI0004D48527|nr:hypothetical protein [Xenorhabdus bovienii]CDG86473.1 putative membrane protein [Xenorhabdus bovienii str. feltiae France]CDG90757.1 putative membrane protein [Xenorhabdus bovienii str. feltiae Florida]
MEKTDKNISLGYFWLLGCNLYFTQITQFSPIYLIFLILTLYIFLCSVINRTFIIDKLSIAFLLTTILSLILLFNSPLNMVSNIIICLISPIITYKCFNNNIISKKIIILIFLTLAFIFIFDGIWRLCNPNLENKEALENLDLGYMIYKTNSIMYRDSNFLGVHILIILSSFLFIFKDKKLKKTIFYTIIFLFLLAIVLTFSRASFISSLICIYFYIMTNNKNRKLFLLITTPVLIISIIPFFIQTYQNDISFNSKFHLIDLAISKISTSSLFDILLGYGLGNSINIIGIGAHNFLLTILLEMGLIFFILFLVYLIYLIKVFRSDFLYLVFPFIMSSLSLSGTSLPYFFSYITLCILIHNKKSSMN